ncbi:MAG: type II toxin-antitoxin system VapC family toxin [Pseudonocardiaceae bacterium]
MSFLLDTNVVSELRKRTPDAGVAAWFDSVDSRQLYLSVLTVGEIRQGICRLQRRDPVQAAVFDQWLAGLLRGYSDCVVPVTAEVAEEWGRLKRPRSGTRRRRPAGRHREGARLDARHPQHQPRRHHRSAAAQPVLELT